MPDLPQADPPSRRSLDEEPHPATGREALLIGAIFTILGAMGRGVGGRSTYF